MGVGLLLALLPGARTALGEPLPLEARVIWVSGERAYLVSPDSTVLEAGTRLTFVERGRTIATGEVVSVHEHELAIARLTSGSLALALHLERIDVLAEGPSRGASGPLRIGLPSIRRFNLLFSCAQTSVAPPVSHRVEEMEGGSLRLVRTGAAPAGRWPDTLFVRFFDESADEEIALERDELDVGVFWPGELSSHMRDRPRWQGSPAGTRSHGVLVAVGSAPPERPGVLPAGYPDSLALAALNRELFRNDLEAWADGPGRFVNPPGVAHVAVDRSSPGAAVIERFLNGGRRSLAADLTAIRLVHLDAPIRDADSLGLAAIAHVRTAAFPPALRARAGALNARLRNPAPTVSPLAPETAARTAHDSLGVRFLFAIRCPVLCAPERRAEVGAIGAGALVDLLGCRQFARTP